MRSIAKIVRSANRAIEGVRRRLRQWWFRHILGALGRGTVIDRNVVISDPERVFIGSYVIINRDVILQGSAGGKISIGSRCNISYKAMLLTAGLEVPFVFTGSNHAHVYKDIVIGDDVWLGAGVIVLPGTVIEDNVVVAAGAVARGHLNSGWYYGGIPAKPIKPIAPQS